MLKCYPPSYLASDFKIAQPISFNPSENDLLLRSYFFLEMCQRKSPRQDRDAWRAIGVSSTLTATLVFAISFNHPDSFFYHKFIYTIHISRDRPRSITPCACTFAVAPNDDNPNKSSFSTKHNLSFWAHRIRVIAYSISQRREAFALCTQHITSAWRFYNLASRGS